MRGPASCSLVRKAKEVQPVERNQFAAQEDFILVKIEELERFDLRDDVTLWQEVAQLFEQLEERRAP